MVNRLLRSLVVLATLVVGCESSAQGRDRWPPLRPIGDLALPTDEALFQAAYSGQKYPDGFFTDPDVRKSRRAFLRRYVETDDYDGMTMSRQRVVEHPCADSAAEALAMLQTPDGLVEGPSTERYFEFGPTDTSAARSGARVYKCSFAERVVYGSTPEHLGVIVGLGPVNARPVTPAAIEAWLDQEWFYRHYNLGGQFLISRATYEREEVVIYEAIEGEVVSRYPGSGSCDWIVVWRSAYYVRKDTGRSHVSYNPEKEIRGRCS